jgi:F0F1-type ATP synthase assembly protein I
MPTTFAIPHSLSYADHETEEKLMPSNFPLQVLVVVVALVLVGLLLSWLRDRHRRRRRGG